MKQLRGKERAGKQTPAAAVAPANDGLSCGPACSPFFAKSNASNTSDSEFGLSRCGLAGKERRSLGNIDLFKLSMLPKGADDTAASQG